MTFSQERYSCSWRTFAFSKLYAPSGLDAHVEPEKGAGGRPAATALRQAARRSGWAGMARAAAERLVAVSEPRISRVRESAIGRWYAMRKTATRRIAAGVCPDCVAPLQRTAAGPACSACEIMLVGV